MSYTVVEKSNVILIEQTRGKFEKRELIQKPAALPCYSPIPNEELYKPLFQPRLMLAYFRPISRLAPAFWSESTMACLGTWRSSAFSPIVEAIQYFLHKVRSWSSLLSQSWFVCAAAASVIGKNLTARGSIPESLDGHARLSPSRIDQVSCHLSPHEA